MAVEEVGELFSRGAVVRLKTGGPKMTVEKIAGDPVDGILTHIVIPKGEAHCVWFDNNNELHRERFRTSTLIGC